MFSQSAEYYDALYAFRDYVAETALIAGVVRAVHPRALTLLDVACGTAEHARRLACNHGFAVDGLDLDEGLLRVARAKHPDGTFSCADMSDFSLPQRYDGVLCLFSSIGYLVTADRTRRALECFRRHLAPGGLALVEPWFRPGELEHGFVSRLSGTSGSHTVERVGRTEIAGRLSRLHFDYRIETPDGVRTASETHELGIFTNDEMAEIFESAGLRASFDPVGLSGRGLWVARDAA
jgi:SAM-dependent methyltransferase